MVIVSPTSKVFVSSTPSRLTTVTVSFPAGVGSVGASVGFGASVGAAVGATVGSISSGHVNVECIRMFSYPGRITYLSIILVKS